MSVPEVNERSAARLTVDFLDFADSPSAPTSATYQVFVRDTGLELKAEAALTPAAQVEIDLDSDSTQIIDDAKSREAHTVLVKATYGAKDEVNGSFTFDVVNLKKLSGTT
jgi:hypothetical protein